MTEEEAERLQKEIFLREYMEEMHLKDLGVKSKRKTKHKAKRKAKDK